MYIYVYMLNMFVPNQCDTKLDNVSQNEKKGGDRWAMGGNKIFFNFI